LSGDILKHKKVHREAYIDALKKVRYKLFLDLYSTNEIVRCFAGKHTIEQLPQLDDWALGLASAWTRPTMWGRQGNIRPANYGASWSLLSQARTVFLVDDSGSMHAQVGGGADGMYVNQTRWQAVQDILQHVTPILNQYAPEGVDVHFLNHDQWYVPVVSLLLLPLLRWLCLVIPG
jgi:hypothetical protein